MNFVNPIEQLANGDIYGLYNLLIYLVVAIIIWNFLISTIRFLFILHQNKSALYLKIRIPREDSVKDNERKEEKDFREKISIMEQFFRNIHELAELSMRNIIRTSLFTSNIISFEIVAQKKLIDFYIVVPKIYRELVEKQVTSYYPNADIIPEQKYPLAPHGNKLRMYYAYAKEKYWFPFKTYKTLETDPLNDLTNIFSKLEENEMAGIQVCLRPLRSRKYNKKSEKIASLLFKGKEPPRFSFPGFNFIYNLFAGVIGGYDKMRFDKPNDQTGFVRMLQPLEERAKKMGEKAAQPSFRIVMRFFGSAPTITRAENITNNVNLALNMYKDEFSNWFQTRRIVPFDVINNAIMQFNYQERLIDSGPILSEKRNIFGPEELASIFHLPCSRYNHTPGINWLPYKVLPAPNDVPNEGVLLGYNVYRGIKKEIRMLRKDRTRHHYCIGKSGSGKSVFLSYLARQDIKAGDGLCVIDPHGDLIEELITFVPKERAKDVVVFNPSDTERPMGLNILEANTPEEMDMASSQATEIFIKLFGDEIFGPRIQHYFRNACLTLMEDKDEGATLIDVPRIFVDDEFMKYKVSKITNPVVKSFWEHEYAHTGDREKQEMIPYFSSKFGPFITNSIMRNTIGQTKSAFNFRQAMDNQQVLLINLSKGKIGDLNTQLLGLVVVARIQMAAMSRVDIPEDQRKDFYLYVDEFQNFSTDSFASILSEARKYHLALIMANQYIKQLEKKQDTTIRDAVFGNVGTMMSFKVGADDGEYLAKEYAPVLTEQDIIGIANYKAYIKLNINNTTSRP
ncbi:MAG: type IV secretion system DNA-binding domain-containing protein, partial [Candidatus Altimarinota bacterium]